MNEIVLNDPEFLDSFNIFEEGQNSKQIQELEQQNKKQKIDIKTLLDSLNSLRTCISSQDAIIKEHEKIIDDLKRKNEAQQKELETKDRTIKKKDRENKTLTEYMVFMESQANILQQVTQGAIDARDETIKGLEKKIMHNHYLFYGRIRPK